MGGLIESEEYQELKIRRTVVSERVGQKTI